MEEKIGLQKQFIITYKIAKAVVNISLERYFRLFT